VLVTLTLQGTVARASLDPRAAPMTCAALRALLPITTTAHYAKIAGQEIYAHLPLIVDPEHTKTVTGLHKGAVVFWPERQLFCVHYGRIQEEDAQVTFLGHVTENLDGLRAAGEELRRAQGLRCVPLRLALGDRAPGSTARTRTAGTPHPWGGDAEGVVAAYLAMVRRAPPEVTALMRRRGVMRPAGALMYAEAESRKLHEVLWMLRGHLRRSHDIPEFARTLLDHCVLRLGGWCGLHEAAALIRETVDEIRRLPPERRAEALEALILYVGRLNMWLDALIPWDAVNTVLQGSVDVVAEIPGVEV
jgi:hypothetical protein